MGWRGEQCWPQSHAHPVRTRSDHCSMIWRDREGSVVTVCVTSLEGSMSPWIMRTSCATSYKCIRWSISQLL